MLFLPSWLPRLLPCLAQVPQKRPLFSFCELNKQNRTKTETHTHKSPTLSHTHNAAVSTVRTEAGFTRCGQRWLGLSGCRGAQGFLASRVWVHTLVTCFCENDQGTPNKAAEGATGERLKERRHHKTEEEGPPDGTKTGTLGQQDTGCPGLPCGSVRGTSCTPTAHPAL